MKDRASALRYARALEAALDGDAQMSAAAEALTRASEIVSADSVVVAAMSSPGVGLERRRALLATLVNGIAAPERAGALLSIMVENGHFHLLPEMAQHFAAARDRRLGIVQALVTTASSLTPDLAERARSTLETTTGRKIRLELRTDPSIIGGMIAKVGSTVYDGSVKARLAALRSHIARG